MALMNSFKKPMGGGKPTPGGKFEDDGPPDMASGEARGSGGSMADSEGEDAMLPSDMGAMAEDGAGDDTSGGYGDIEDASADTLADLAGVSPDDRDDFKTALQTYVSSCVSKAMSEGSQSDMESSGDTSEEG